MAKYKAKETVSYDNGLGKLPPQAVEVEQAILGAIMIERDAFLDVSTFLSESDFYKEAHQRIYAAFMRLSLLSEPIDLMTTTVELRKSGELELCGGAQYVTGLTQAVNSSANIVAHGRIVKQMSMGRQIITICSEGLRMAYDDTTDVISLAGNMLEKFYAVNQLDAPEMSFAKQIDETVRQISAFRQGQSYGIPSKFGQMNKILNGGYRKEFYLKAARPAMGKSIVMINEAVHMAKLGLKVVIFSLEMSYFLQTCRMLSLETTIKGQSLSTGNLDDYEMSVLRSRAYQLAGLGITVYDMSTITNSKMKALCTKLKRTTGLDVVFLDYIQLVDSEDSNEAKEKSYHKINAVSATCRRLPKDLDVTVIALSQLSRAVEQRGGDKKPQLSDLRESGNLEQDAFAVSFLYRPEYYGIVSYEDGSSTAGICHEIVAKNRGGGLDEAFYHFDGSRSLCCDLDSIPQKMVKQTPF